MKQISFIKTAFFFLIIAGNSIAYAQVNENDVVSLSPSRKPKTDPISGLAAGPTEKVLGVFNRTFTNASSVSWSTEKNGLPIAFFETPGKKNRAGFDKKGNLVYTISSYKEEQLPVSVLMKVKQTYFGRSIFCVTEVNYDGKTAYLIILEDRTTWLHIKVIGDEMEEEHLYIKG